MTTSEQINELAAALAKAQGQIVGAVKDSANPFFKSSYADLASVWDACRKPLSDNGLSVIQAPSAAGALVTVTTLLLHVSGQWAKSELTATAKDDSGQAIGSIITYLRRYSIAAFVSVCPVDDDGEAAQGRAKPPAAPVVKAPTGFQGWIEELEAVTPEGTKPLQAAWKASKAEFRQYLTATNPKHWDAIKAAAAKADMTTHEAA